MFCLHHLSQNNKTIHGNFSFLSSWWNSENGIAFAFENFVLLYFPFWCPKSTFSYPSHACLLSSLWKLQLQEQQGSFLQKRLLRALPHIRKQITKAWKLVELSGRPFVQFPAIQSNFGCWTHHCHFLKLFVKWLAFVFTNLIWNFVSIPLFHLYKLTNQHVVILGLNKWLQRDQVYANSVSRLLAFCMSWQEPYLIYSAAVSINHIAVLLLHKIFMWGVVYLHMKFDSTFTN